MNAAARQFEITPAVRRTVGLLIGLVGPSSSGKTYSALRVATGIQRVCGGDIDVIDTENGRALYYADKFKFNHLRFAAPFSPDDYLEAIRFCARRGSKTILIDSMSHEHEGPGGVLEWHKAETERLAARWKTSPEKAQMAAWGPPKTARRRLINELLQLNVNLIMTFRAKEKIKMVPGKDPVPLGWQPICGDEFMYEMVLQALLLPGSEGRPTWTPEMPAERAMVKLPTQFREMFTVQGAQLDEAVGEKLAQWAAGGVKGNAEVDALVADYVKCENAEQLAALEKRREALWKKIQGADKQRLKEGSEAAQRRYGPRIDTDQGTLINDHLREEGIETTLFCAHFEIGTVSELPSARYREAMLWIEERSKGTGALDLKS
jgi:AAA domain